MSRGGAIAPRVALLALLWAAPWAALAQTTERVSVAGAAEQADGGSSAPSISADGRYVAFASSAVNLVSGDTNGAEDVFARDRQTGATERLSLGSEGEQADAASSAPSISADGRYVAFVSSAANLVAGDTNGVADVFVRDRRSGATERVSVSSRGEQADAASFGPSISADGRYVAFAADAANLVAGDTNAASDVFVRDRRGGTTERVSVGGRGEQPSGSSFGPSISADGRFVAFASDAANLLAGDTNEVQDVFARDRRAGATERVSVSSAGEQGDASSDSPSISADGRFIAFRSRGSNLVAGDTNHAADAFVRDRQASATERVSVSTRGEQANEASAAPSISADGRFIAFASLASNLAAGDANGRFDVIVFDRRTGVSERVSLGESAEDGDEGSGRNGPPSISADGRFVAFVSRASNLVAGDTNGLDDAFVRLRRVASGGPATVVLTPAADTSSVGAERCVTAAVSEAVDTPAAEVPVEFTISGIDGQSDTVLTDANGQASFCYAASDLPGEVTITATAQGGTNPSDTALQTIVPPPSGARCKLRYLGRIDLGSGQSAAFSGFAFVVGGEARGDQNYRDSGFRTGVRVESLATDALVCGEGWATILGRAKAQDGRSVVYRIDLHDESPRGQLDRYRIRLGNGYDSGDRRLSSGSVDLGD